MNGKEKLYNIVIAPNGAYTKYALVLLNSLFETNSDKRFRIFVLYNSLTEEEKAMISKFVKERNSIIEYIHVNEGKYRVFQWKNRFSVETYFRLEIQDVLPREVERALYLDIDMIICSDISELYNLDFENKYMAACGFSPYCERGDEFNAGMILFNMEKMRRDITFDTYTDLAKKLRGEFYQDQGLLNAQFGDDGTKYVWKQKYNFTCAFYRKYMEEVLKEDPDFSLNDVVVLHYPGPGIRPWQALITQEEYERFVKNNLLELFSLKGYLIDELYVEVQRKWWDFAERTPVYADLLAEMNRSKSLILEEVLIAAVNAKDYQLGKKILKIPRIIKKVCGRKQ
ncbi:MAG: glycosyltransferase family 8 protein [Lachnospiraceae bacterium]|nr:glycosyltransferase family 8 protein [Lachnospiraceae bacterium]